MVACGPLFMLILVQQKIMPFDGSMKNDEGNETMKVIKRILFGIVGLVLAASFGILICALNPSLTNSIAQKIQAMQSGPSGDGQNGTTGVDTRAPGVLPESVPGINADWLADRENRGYLLPGEEPGNPPAEVNGLTGYQPVSEDAQQVLEEEADTIAPGELGEGLAFDENYYPYYAMLEADLRRLYNQIYANASQLITSFTPVEDVDLDRLKRVFEAVYNDHPELFWLESGFSCKYLESGTCVEITLEYNDTISDLPAARERFLEEAEAILSQARNLHSDYERERYVHDALAERVEYDVNSNVNQSAYSGLVTSRTVCAGYARAFQYLMQQLGIPCYYCTGYAGEDHAWNIVRLEGEYYNVDVTWDDTAQLTHDYFNRTDAEFAPTHIRTRLSVYLPACMGTAFGESYTEPDTTQTDEDEDSEKSDEVQLPAEPMKPLVYVSPVGTNNQDQELTEEEKQQAAEEQRRKNMEQAGVTEDEVMDTMEEYYADCKTQMRIIGVGDGQFSNVVPSTLWNSVELSYSLGSYKTGYVNDILKEFGVENFYIQLQIQDLGAGYYRVYHNVLTE